MNIIIFGPPGSGKGTQARLLADRYGIPHISPGAMFRAAMKSKTKIGLQIKDFMDKGNYVPDDITIAMVKKRLEDVDCAEGFMIDGFPRNLPQAEALDEFAHIDFVIVLKVSDKEVINRLSKRRQCPKCDKITSTEEGEKCRDCKVKLVQRDDDKPQVIKNRLLVYHDLTQPLIEYYKNKDIVRMINGEQSEENVFKDILLGLGDTE
ncbi:adenylate kinase [Candidatus Woesearchaeota archaeon]|nr:adenylate kinase [Candidatus Woesearchaeota archaeon]